MAFPPKKTPPGMRIETSREWENRSSVSANSRQPTSSALDGGTAGKRNIFRSDGNISKE